MKVATLAGGSLLVVALAVASLLAALEVFSPSEMWGPGGAFRTGLFATLVLGASPALLLGVPAYWLLWRAGRTRWVSVVLLGGALGALVALVEPALAGWGVSCGIIAASLTHLAACRWLGPGCSSGPTPLPGAAVGESPSNVT